MNYKSRQSPNKMLGSHQFRNNAVTRGKNFEARKATEPALSSVRGVRGKTMGGREAAESRIWTLPHHRGRDSQERARRTLYRAESIPQEKFLSTPCSKCEEADHKIWR